MMDHNQKSKLLEERKQLVDSVRAGVRQEQERAETVFNKSYKEIARMSSEEQQVWTHLYQIGQVRKEELRLMESNPFFARLTVAFEDKDPKPLCIGKFSLPEQDIYSWVTPIATLRFEELGNASYVLPNKTTKHAELKDKESYMISGGEISYLSREDSEYGKTLIYQKHFSEQLEAFGLSEIVSTMEKTQDIVIRAHHTGPFLISGPAGSGKTTVALHRIAYLRQSPETTDIYPAKSCVVFVQDRGTKEYFTKLLPDLGINDVSIVTFDEWALNVLDIGDTYSFTERVGETFEEKNRYEYLKVELIKRYKGTGTFFKDPFRTLASVYQELPDEFQDLFRTQREKKVLDKQDLTLLLSTYFHAKGSLEEVQSYYVKKKEGGSERKTRRVAVRYRLILVDEFQNYTPAQLSLIRSVLSEKTQSIVYVGDLNQQTHIGSIQSWDEIGEEFSSDRKVSLQKVYRNDPSILRFLGILGYSVVESGREEYGEAMFLFGLDTASQLSHVKELLLKNPAHHVGILAFDESQLILFREQLGSEDRIHMMTVNKAQGLEFDSVYIIGLSEKLFDSDFSNMPEGYQKAYADTVTDYLYVACTRPKKNLYVCVDRDISLRMKEFVTESRSRRS